MPVHDDLGNRMKGYEKVTDTKLVRRMPVILRLDMRAGHTFTRGFVRPFDEVFMKSMQETARYLCENIQGAVLAYVQSDEITIVLVDYSKLESECFFDYRIEKLCSIAASMTTMAFNDFFSSNCHEFNWDCCKESFGDKIDCGREEDYKRCIEVYQPKIGTAMFDARCFNIPKEEVTNCIYWRQLDATRNSIHMVGHANFSHKELQNKSCNMIQDMLVEQKGIDWNDLPTYQKRGSCVVKKNIVNNNGDIVANPWIIDVEIPIFKGDGRAYIDELIYVGEE